MSRGSQILIGVICLALAVVLCMLAPVTGPTAPWGVAGMLITAALAGVIGFTCVFTWGRPTSTRIAMGLLSIAMIAMLVYVALSPRPSPGPICFCALVASMSGGYAVSGAYPRGWYLSEVFGTAQTRQKNVDKLNAQATLKRALRKAIALEKEGEHEAAIRQYRRVARLAGPGHPNADLAQSRIDELEDRLE